MNLRVWLYDIYHIKYKLTNTIDVLTVMSTRIDGDRHIIRHDLRVRILIWELITWWQSNLIQRWEAYWDFCKNYEWRVAAACYFTTIHRSKPLSQTVSTVHRFRWSSKCSRPLVESVFKFRLFDGGPRNIRKILVCSKSIQDWIVKKLLPWI